MKVVFVSSEVAPYAKTGGLADVSAALPVFLAERGVEVSIVTPLYATTPRAGLTRILEGIPVPRRLDRMHADVWQTEFDGVRVFFLDPPGYFERPYLYGPPSGDYVDNPFRFAFLSRGTLALCEAIDLVPDVFHVHDWQSGLLPLYLRRQHAQGPLRYAATVFTIHNLGYQGNFPIDVLEPLGIGADLWSWHGLEFFGHLSFLKSGILFADRISTVSPTYAREIQTPEFGHGLDGFVRTWSGKLRGILNGIDDRVWDPRVDPVLPVHYHAEDLAGKARCKARLQELAGLPVRPETPLFTVISRLAEQKGWDLFAQIADDWLAQNEVQLTVLGTGTPVLEGFFRDLQTRYPDQVSTNIGFDEEQAHRAQAGADFLLMPSRYEPCGLSQMYALRYGTVPVVRATGGLDDTVVDPLDDPAHATGFKFHGYEPGALLVALQRARSAYLAKEPFLAMVRRGMGEDFSWRRTAGEYLDLYEAAMKERP